MAVKTEKVVTTTTKVAANGTKTVTTTTTETTTRRKDDGWWNGLSGLAKALLILGALLVVGIVIGVIWLGRAKVASNSMDTKFAKGSTVWFSRFSSPKRGDVLVFRHPEADSVILTSPDKNYYKMCRLYGDAWCNKKVDPIVFQGKKKRPILLSRCIGLPGDVVAIKNNTVFVNNDSVADVNTARYTFLTISSDLIGPDALAQVGINKSDIAYSGEDAETLISFYHNAIPANCQATLYTLTEDAANALLRSELVRKIQRVSVPKDFYERTVFPYIEKLHWNSSNFGPLSIPEKGKVVKLNTKLLPLYRRCIETYEGNKVEVKGDDIYIDGNKTDSYRFRRNYYFVLGDNRSTEDDSRYFGFVPDKYVMGVACE